MEYFAIELTEESKFIIFAGLILGFTLHKVKFIVNRIIVRHKAKKSNIKIPKLKWYEWLL